ARALDALQELLGYDLVGVHIGAVQRHNQRSQGTKRLHYAVTSSRASHVRMSTKWPAMAAAAAIAGETRCVRPPRPCRPSKLRLLVEAQRSPGARMSGFMPRHIEQPGSRQSKPAALKILSRPSSSAWRFTWPEPGTTMACTVAATCLPSARCAARRRSSMRPLVQEPINTRSIFK